MAGIATHVQGGDVDAQKIQINGQLVIDSNGQWVGDSPPVSWSTISDIPSDVSDGDNDTQLSEGDVEGYITNESINLASGSMVNGESIVTSSTDQLLSESDVEGFVTNGALDLAEGTTIGGKVLQEAISCQEGQILEYSGSLGWSCSYDSVLTYDDVLGYVTQNPIDLADGSSINTSPILTESSSLQWGNINGVPSDLSDGDDNTQLSQGDVVSFVTDSQVNLGVGSQVNGAAILTQPSTCNNGEVLIYQGTGWMCGVDTDTTLTAQEVQQMVELMSLNLASLQVNGADVLTTASTISWNQITDVPTEVLESSDTLADLNCLDGEIVTSNGGTWECSLFGICLSPFCLCRSTSQTSL